MEGVAARYLAAAKLPPPAATRTTNPHNNRQLFTEAIINYAMVYLTTMSIPPLSTSLESHNQHVADLQQTLNNLTGNTLPESSVSEQIKFLQYLIQVMSHNRNLRLTQELSEAFIYLHTCCTKILALQHLIPEQLRFAQNNLKILEVDCAVFDIQRLHQYKERTTMQQSEPDAQRVIQDSFNILQQKNRLIFAKYIQLLQPNLMLGYGYSLGTILEIYENLHQLTSNLKCDLDFDKFKQRLLEPKEQNPDNYLGLLFAADYYCTRFCAPKDAMKMHLLMLGTVTDKLTTPADNPTLLQLLVNIHAIVPYLSDCYKKCSSDEQKAYYSHIQSVISKLGADLSSIPDSEIIPSKQMACYATFFCDVLSITNTVEQSSPNIALHTLRLVDHLLVKITKPNVDHRVSMSEEDINNLRAQIKLLTCRIILHIRLQIDISSQNHQSANSLFKTNAATSTQNLCTNFNNIIGIIPQIKSDVTEQYRLIIEVLTTIAENLPDNSIFPKPNTNLNLLITEFPVTFDCNIMENRQVCDAFKSVITTICTKAGKNQQAINNIFGQIQIRMPSSQF